MMLELEKTDIGRGAYLASKAMFTGVGCCYAAVNVDLSPRGLKLGCSLYYGTLLCSTPASLRGRCRPFRDVQNLQSACTSTSSAAVALFPLSSLQQPCFASPSWIAGNRAGSQANGDERLGQTKHRLCCPASNDAYLVRQC